MMVGDLIAGPKDSYRASTYYGEIMVKYIVGWKDKTRMDGVAKDFYKVPTDGPEFHTLEIPRYYYVTDNGFGSTSNPDRGTWYEDYWEAEEWNNKWLHGDGTIFRN